MLPRALWIPTELIARAAEAIDEDEHGVRRTILRGMQLGLVWAIVGRIWMRQIADERMFSVPGTIFIFIVVSGFAAAAGYAFAQRRRRWGRSRRWLHRFLAFVPVLGMGPFVVFFLGNAVCALLGAHEGWRRLVRWPLLGLGAAITAFWTLVFVGQNPDGQGWASALLYLGLSYLLFVSLRFALDPAATHRSHEHAGIAIEV